MPEEKTKVTTISIPDKVRNRGQEAAKRMFGSNKKFSTYIQVLINRDCDEKNIK